MMYAFPGVTRAAWTVRAVCVDVVRVTRPGSPHDNARSSCRKYIHLAERGEREI